MIKFFRHIRRNLMETGKTSRYLKYAIGEILLVVIGILIALQINTWNNNQVNNRKEKEYLNNLLGDIEIQSKITLDQIAHEKLMRQNCEKALRNLNSSSPDPDSLNVYLTAITRKTFVIHNPTFQDLKSSGNILLIEDNILRNKILSFYQYSDYSASVIEISNLKSISEFRDYLLKESVVNMNYLDTVKVAGGVDWSLNSVDVTWAGDMQRQRLKDREFLFQLLNVVSQRGRTSSVHIDLMSRMDNRIVEIKTDINSYLNN